MMVFVFELLHKSWILEAATWTIFVCLMDFATNQTKYYSSVHYIVLFVQVTPSVERVVVNKS